MPIDCGIPNSVSYNIDYSGCSNRGSYWSREEQDAFKYCEEHEEEALKHCEDCAIVDKTLCRKVRVWPSGNPKSKYMMVLGANP